MKARRFLLVLLAYLAFDLADPMLPGAFSFEAEDSEIEDAVYVRFQRDGREADAVRPAPEPGWLARRDDSAPRPPMLRSTHRPGRDPAPAWQAPRSALFALAAPPSPEDH